MEQIRKAKKSLLRRLALEKGNKLSSPVIRLLILLFVLNPTGEYRPDYSMRSSKCEGFCGCNAIFKMCLFNPLSWIFIVIMFFYCMVACGLEEFFQDFKKDVFGVHYIYIKKIGLRQELDV